jgi:hypothetical protein
VARWIFSVDPAAQTRVPGGPEVAGWLGATRQPQSARQTKPAIGNESFFDVFIQFFLAA